MSSRRPVPPAARSSRSAAGACLLAMAALSSCAPEDGDGGEVLRARRGAFQATLVLTGELQAAEWQELLVPREAAWRNPIRWMAEDGSTVEKGDLVVEFDNQAEVSALQEADLRRIQAANDLASKRAEGAAELADKEIELERKRSEHDVAAILAEVPEGLLSEREHAQRQLALREAEIELSKAEEALAAFRLGLEADLANAQLAHDKAVRDFETAREAIEVLSLRAPADGLFLVNEHPWEGRKVEVGDTLFAGWTVGSLPDLSSVKVEAWLSDVDEGRIVVGLPATCTLDTWPGRELSGRIAAISPVAEESDGDSLRRAFRVDVELDEADPERMIPGMSVRVAVQASRRDGVVTAPRAALELDVEPPLAHLADGTPVELELGECNPLECVVRRGLRDGDELLPRGAS